MSLCLFVCFSVSLSLSPYLCVGCLFCSSAPIKSIIIALAQKFNLHIILKGKPSSAGGQGLGRGAGLGQGQGPGRGAGLGLEKQTTKARLGVFSVPSGGAKAEKLTLQDYAMALHRIMEKEQESLRALITTHSHHSHSHQSHSHSQLTSTSSTASTAAAAKLALYERFCRPFRDALRSPLQPLADNLDSKTYSVMEEV